MYVSKAYAQVYHVKLLYSSRIRDLPLSNGPAHYLPTYLPTLLVIGSITL